MENLFESVTLDVQVRMGLYYFNYFILNGKYI